MKRIVSIFLFMAISLACVAQIGGVVPISTSQLKGTKWKIEGDDSGDYDEYTASKIIWRRENGTFATYPYYLTDTPFTSHEYSAFDHSKVGKNTKGSYIVMLNTKAKVVYCAAILTFNKKEGIWITKLVTEGLIGIGDGIDRYILIK